MCATCGCDGKGPLILSPHSHDHDDHHAYDHGAALRKAERLVKIEQDVLAKNDRLAAANRAWLAGREVLALNVLSGPGAGKTTLLERTVALLAPVTVSVLEGDQETAHDAERVRAAGAAAVQINTGTGCHLDAEMVAGGLRALAPPSRSVVFIENVGNLVCPALFDLGERTKVVLLSTTEGEDKPLKYPHIFRAARVLLLNKIDLLPHLSFDLDRCLANARRVNPHLRVFVVSALRGDGLDAWCGWLRAELAPTAEATGDHAW